MGVDMRVDAALVLFVVLNACCLAYSREGERALDLRSCANLNHTVRPIVYSDEDEWFFFTEQVSVNNGAVLDIVQDRNGIVPTLDPIATTPIWFRS